MANFEIFVPKFDLNFSALTAEIFHSWIIVHYSQFWKLLCQNLTWISALTAKIFHLFLKFQSWARVYFMDKSKIKDLSISDVRKKWKALIVEMEF